MCVDVCDHTGECVYGVCIPVALVDPFESHFVRFEQGKKIAECLVCRLCSQVTELVIRRH